jgi:hypothetical protein
MMILGITLTNLFEVLLLIGICFAMFKAGQQYILWRIEQDIIAYENGELELEDDDDDEESTILNSAIEIMKIKKVDNAFYAYGSGDRFLTQSADLHGLFTNIRDTFPNTTWLIDDEKHESLSTTEHNSIMPTLSSIFSKDKDLIEK